MACSTGCPNPGTHASYGECMRDKGSRVAYCNSASGQDYTTQKRWDRDLAAYRDAKAQGVQPATTKRVDVERAMRISDESGRAWKA